MTFNSAEAVASGRPYPVLEVSGAAPSDLAQFVGDAMFIIDRDGTRSEVSGQGAEHDPGVVFREKEMSHGRDVRVWQISESAGSFTASTLPGF